MKKKIIILPLLLTLIAGCGTDLSSGITTSDEGPTSNNPITSQNPSTSEDDISIDPITSDDLSSEPISSEDVTSEPISSEDVTSEPGTSFPDTSTPGTSQPDIVYTNFAQIRDKAMTFAPLVNGAKIYASTIKASFRAQLLLLQDYIAGGNDYTFRNKALVANDTGYMLVSMNSTDYSLIKDYVKDQQVYDFEGTISLYNGEAEVTLTKRPSYLAGVSLDYTLTKEDGFSIQNIFNQLKLMPLNNKAIGYMARPFTLTLKYLLKLENSIALFTDGTNVIQVYGHDRINNNFVLGTVYDLTFMPGLYINKPSFTYISHQASNEEIAVLEVEKTMGAVELYSYSYVKEPKYQSDFIKNLEYAETLINAYIFEGYVNYYTKDNQDNISFDDTAKSPYTTYTNAMNAKSLFINNESGLKIYTPTDALNCIFWDEAIKSPEAKNLVDFIFVPYLMNQVGYFQIHVFEDTYSELIVD